MKELTTGGEGGEKRGEGGEEGEGGGGRLRYSVCRGTCIVLWMAILFLVARADIQ